MMEELLLVRPKIDYLAQIYSYKQEFIDHNENMSGTSDLRSFDNVEDWLEFVIRNEALATCTAGYVPDSQFLTIRKADQRLVGMIDVRHVLNEYLLQYAGHIGYSIRKSERQKGYAKEQLRLALTEAGKLGLSRVLITCDKENAASRNVILSAGGIMENEVPQDGLVTQRYWINID